MHGNIPTKCPANLSILLNLSKNALTKCCIYDSIYMKGSGLNICRDRKIIRGCQGLGKGRNGGWLLIGMGSLWGDKNVLEVVVTVAQPCVYTKKHRSVHFKRENCMAYELYL